MSRALSMVVAGLVTVAVACAFIWFFYFRGVHLPGPEPGAFNAGAQVVVASAQQQVRNQPGSAAAWGRLGMVYMVHQQPAAALDCLRRAEQLQPDEGKWPYLQSIILTTGVRPQEALAALQRAVQRTGNEPASPRVKIIQLYLENGQQKLAAAEIRKLLAGDQAHAIGQLNLARILVSREEWEPALAALAHCKTSVHTARQAHALFAQIYQRTGEQSAAEAALNTIADLPPDRPWPDPFLEEAMALRSSRHHLTSRYHRLIQVGQTDEAGQVFAEAERNYRELYWLMEGQLHLKRGDAAQAERAFRKSLTFDPGHIESQSALAVALAMQQKDQHAREVIEKLLKQEPAYGPAYLVLGQCLLKQGETAGALTAYRNAVRYSPLNAESHFQLGRFLAANGQTDEARAELQTALRLDSNLTAARQALRKLP